MFSASKTAGPSGYNLTNSLRFRASASAFLSRTPASAGNQQKFTWSGWVKRGQMLAQSGNSMVLMTAGTGSTNNAWIYFNGDNIAFFSKNSSTISADVYSASVQRDPSAWYHIVCAVDSTQGTSANRVRIYVNNVEQSLVNPTAPTLNFNTVFNTTIAHNIAKDTLSTLYFFDGYMTDINWIDGQQLTPSSFGSFNATTGVWQPKKYTGSYGTNGFYLNFTDIGLTSGSNTGLGRDFSGNGNFFNTNNISVTAGTTYDAMTDVPTLTSATVANYCILNPLSQAASGASYLSQGNLHMFDNSSAAAWRTVFGSHGINIGDGKFYWETTAGPFGASVGGYTGICSQTDNGAPPQTTDVALYWNNAGNFQKERNGSNTALSGTPVAGDVLGVAYDAVNGQIWFSRNGTYFEGNPSAGTGASYTGITMAARPFLSIFSNVGQMSASINFGQRPFAYTPPTGFVALNTFNLPNSTIVKGNSYMDAKLYTGNGGQQTQSGLNFQPDLVWVKARSNAFDHGLANSVVGVGKYLISNSTSAEVTDASGSIIAFNSNGFGQGGSNPFGANGATYVGWAWNAGSGTNTTNTAGSITSTVSVNTTAGFSIVTFNAGAAGNKTVGHGLGVAPAFWIVKSTGGGNSWSVGSQALAVPAARFLALDLTSSVFTDTRIWANTAPSSTVLSFESGYTLVANANAVAYCWAEIAGFSRFGSYTGNGASDGPFIYTGFRPKFVMIKSSSAGGAGYNWTLYDTSRNPYNVADLQLNANLSDAEAVSNQIDILSNGFKIFGGGVRHNGSGTTYIYAAFAENPFKNALAR